MAIVLGTDDPVFSNGKQTTAPKPIPAPAPAPAPAAVYDYQQYTDPYTAIPDSQGYAAPIPDVVDSAPYWVNDPGYVGSGGGYTLDPKTGLVWIDPLNRWGTLTELQNAFYGAGTGAYGEYVAPGGVPAVPAPVSVGSRAPDFLDFGPPPPVPETVNIDNQVTAYGTDYTTPYAEDFAPGGGPNLIPLDMTPSSRNSPNITTSRGNIWDSTMQTWIDPNGYIRNPITQKWQTPDEYAVYLSGGTPSVDYGITRRAIGAAMDGIGGTYIEPDQTFDALGPFPGSSLFDIPDNLRGISLARVSNAANTAREISALRDPSPYQFSAPPAPAGAPADLPDRANTLNVEAYGVDPRDTQYVFSGIDPTQAGLSPGSIPNAWYALYPNGVQILLKSPTEGLIGVDDVVKASFTSFVDKSQADALAKIIVDAAVYNPASYTGNSMFLGASLLLNNPLVRKNTEETISNAIQNNATPVGIAGLVVGGPISNAAFEVAYASTQTLLDNYASGLPGPVRGTLELAAGGLAAYKTGNIGAAGISSLPGMTPDAAKLSGRVAGEGAEISLKLSGKEKVVTTLQGQKMIEEGVARNPRTVSTQLITENGVKKWVQVADPAEILNSNGTLRSGAKVISEVVSETPGQDAKTYLVMFDPISGKSLYVSKSEAQQVVKSIGYTTTVEKNIEVTPDDVAAVLAKVDSVAPVSSDNSVINKYDSIVRVTDFIDQLLDNIDSGAVVVNRQEGQALMRQAMEASGLTVAHNATAEEIINELHKLSLDVSDEITSAAKANGIFSPDKSYEELAEALRKTSVPKTTEVDKEVAAVAFRHGIDTAGKSPDEIIDALRNVKITKVVKEVVQDNPIEAVRPTSLKAGDDILLSEATQGASFGTNQRYKVAEDLSSVGPGTRVKVKNDAGDELVVDAGRVWKIGENADDNIVYFNAGLPLNVADESLTKVWGALNRVMIRGMEADTGPRVGVVLHPAGIDNIGREAPAKQFAKEFDKMIRQLRQTDLPNSVETLSSAYQVYRRDLGRVSDGRLMDVASNAAERADNILHPRLGDVVQNPAAYTLTEKQRQAVANIRGLISQVEAEKRLRGVDEKFLNADNGLGYFPREVDPRATAIKRGEKGRVRSKMELFFTETTGPKLSTRLRDDRMWDTEHEALVKGAIEYVKDDVQVFTNWAKEGLTSAANKHIKNVADARGVTAAQVIDPKYKMRVDQTKKAILSLRERLNTAMKKAGTYKTAEDDLGRMLDDALRLSPDGDPATLKSLPRIMREEKVRIEKLLDRPIGTFKESSEAVANSKRLVTDYISSLKEDITNLKRAAETSGRDAEKYAAARRTAEQLLDRAEKLDKKVDDATEKVYRLLMDQAEVKESIGRAVPGGKRRVRVTTESLTQKQTKTRSSLAAAREIVTDINKELRPLRTDLRKLEIMETRAWTTAEKADLKRAAADATDMFSKARYAAALAAEKETVGSLRDVVDARVGASLERLWKVIDDRLPDGMERLGKYDEFIGRSERHIKRLSELGGKWTDIAADLKQELDSAKVALTKYREVVEKVSDSAEFQLELSGRINLNPAKSGSLFNDRRFYEPEVGKVLKKWFDQKKQPPPWLLKSMNNIYTPLIITADFSSRWATLRRVQMQLGLMKPGATVDANTATFREATSWAAAKLRGATEYTGKADYLVWRTDARTSFAARYMPFRNESSPGEFIFTHGIGNLPLFKQTEMDFTRTWNRVMVEYFYAQADALRSSGKVLTDADYEAIGRSAGRMGGIPWNRAGEWEASLNFAANFFRSHAELHYYALAKGGLEGSLARQQLAVNYAVTSTIVAAFAAWQGRDVLEVLNPLDTNALERGEVRLNSNFMTIRLGSGLDLVDMNVAGEMRSLYFLLWAAGEGVTMSAYKQDVGYLQDAAYYAVSTRGQLPLKLVADMSYGHTFDGKSLTDWKGWVQRVTPITLQNMWDNYDRGMSLPNQALAGALAMIGASVSPITNYEKRDIFIGQMDRFENMSEEDRKFFLRDPNRPPSWNNLKANGKLLVDAEYGKLEASSWDAKVRARKVGEIESEYTEKLQNIDYWWKNTKDAKVEDLLTKVRDAKTEYYYARDLIYGQYDFKDDKDPVNVYRQKMRDLDIPGIGVNFDALEGWLRSQPLEFQREVDAYYSRPLTITGIKIFDRLNTNSRALSDLGYYSAQDSFFTEWAKDNGLPAGTTLDAYKLQLIEGDLQAYKEAVATRPDAEALIDAKRAELWDNVWKNESLQPWYDYFYDNYTRDFIADNPLVALEANTFHRLSVRGDELDAIMALGTTDSQAIRDQLSEGARVEDLIALPDEWSASAWASFTLPSELGISKKATLKETKEAWIADQYGVSDFKQLNEAQQKIGEQNWDKLLGDNKDSWYVVDRQNRIMNFLTLWDNSEDTDRELILGDVLSDERSKWKWMLNASDSAILYRAAVARNDKKLLDWLAENAPKAATAKVDSIKYANLPDAALLPSK